MSPHRFNRMLLLLVGSFLIFSAIAYAASNTGASVSDTHNSLYPKLQESELVWETVLRQVVNALVRR